MFIFIRPSLHYNIAYLRELHYETTSVFNISSFVIKGLILTSIYNLSFNRIGIYIKFNKVFSLEVDKCGTNKDSVYQSLYLSLWI